MTETAPPLQEEDFLHLLRADQERRAHHLRELGEAIKHSPLKADVLAAIQCLGPTDQEKVLVDHPGHVLDRKLNSLWSMLAVFHEAHSALRQQIERLHAFSTTEAMHLPVGRAELDLIEVRVRKELVAFSAAAAALEAFSRRIVGPFNLENFREQVDKNFDQQEHQFIKELRNVICHQEFPHVHWQITYGPSRGVDFILPIRSLDAMGSFKGDALAYIRRWPNGIQLRLVADTYAERVTHFYAWVRTQAENKTPNVLQEYWIILNGCRANAARCAFRLILQQVQGKKINPYEHLHKFLMPDDLKTALALPMRSRDQLDFIIAHADQHGACDDEIRAGIYQLFDLEKNP